MCCVVCCVVYCDGGFFSFIFVSPAFFPVLAFAALWWRASSLWLVLIASGDAALTGLSLCAIAVALILLMPSSLRSSLILTSLLSLSSESIKLIAWCVFDDADDGRAEDIEEGGDGSINELEADDGDVTLKKKEEIDRRAFFCGVFMVEPI